MHIGRGDSFWNRKHLQSQCVQLPVYNVIVYTNSINYKIIPIWDCQKWKKLFAKVENRMFKSHMTPKEDEYQNSLQLKFIVFKYHNLPSVCWLHAHW